MTLDFVYHKTFLCLNPFLQSADQQDVSEIPISFDPNKYLIDNFRTTLLALQEITKINRIMMFKYFMSVIEEHFGIVIESQAIGVGRYKALLTLFQIVNVSFSYIGTAEEYIQNDKKMILMDILLNITENIFGVNTIDVRNCYSRMLLTLSTYSPMFFDGLTTSIQNNFTSKVPPIYFRASIEPWIYLTNDMNRLTSFLKVLTTNLSLVTQSYYSIILDTVTNIIMNVIVSSGEKYTKYLDENSTSITAKQVSEMIEKWNIKPLSKAWVTQFTLLLVQSTELDNQARNVTSKFLKSILEVKEIKTDSDMDALHAILNGFTAISYSGPQPILVRFMKMFINIPINFMKRVFEKKKDIPKSAISMIVVDFSISLLFIDIDLFNTTYASRMLETDKPLYWEQFAFLCKRVCLFTSEKPYSYKNELAALVPLLLKNIQLLLTNIERFGKSMSYIIKGISVNPYFCRITFIENPGVYADVMELMRKGELNGVEQLNLALFDLKYVDDIQGPNFWQMLSILLNTYISLSHTVKFIGSPMFAKVSVLIERAMKYVGAVIKNTDQKALPSTLKWEYILIRIEKIILLLLTRIDVESRKSTISVVKTYLHFITLRPIEKENMITDQLKVLADGEPIHLHRIFAETLRNQELPDLIKYEYSYLNNLFVSISNDFIPNMPTGAVKVEKIEETSLDAKEGIWISTMAICTSLDRKIENDRYDLYKVFLKDKTKFGPKAASIIAYSLPIVFAADMFNMMKSWIHNTISNQPLDKISSSTQVLALNIMNYIICFDKRTDLNENSFEEETISCIFSDLAHFANVSHSAQVRVNFCETTISLISTLKKFNKKPLPMHRFVVAKNMLQWVPPEQDNDPQFQTTCLKAIRSILDGLSFFETTDPVGDKAKATENFTLFLTFIKQGANKRRDSIKEMLDVLTAIMKENFYIGINSCIAMGYDDEPKVRTAFLNGLSSFFSPDVYELIVTTEMHDDIIDLLMEGDFNLVKFLAEKMPYNKTDSFGRELIRAAAYKSREFELFQAMIELELATQTVSSNIEEINRTKLFRGNGTPSKVFSAYAHMVGHQWLCDCIIPIIQKTVQKVNDGQRFQIDPSRTQQDEDIAKNRETFRIAFIEMTDMFVSKLSSLPTGFIKAAQMLYKSVVNQSQKVALQSIASFIFLRFVCPTLPEPIKVGYTDNIDENVRVGLLHLSTLLMIAAVHQKADIKKQYYAYFNDLVGAAHNKLQAAYNTIANTRITDVPLVTTIDSSSVTLELHSLIFPMIPAIQNEAALRNEEEFSERATKLIAILKEMGPLSIKKEEIIVNEVSISLLDKLMKTQFNEALLSTLQSVFFRINQKTRKGEDMFYFNMPAYLKKYPAVYLAKHVFTALKGFENTKYVIIADCGGFDTNLLPQAKEMTDLAKIVPDYIIKNLTAIYVIRLQSNLVDFINETQILQSLSNVKCVSSLDEFRNVVCSKTNFLSEASIEALTIPDSVHSLEVNGEKATINIMQRSIQIRMNRNIGYNIKTNDVIKLVEIDDHLIVKKKYDYSIITLEDERNVKYTIRIPSTSDFLIVLKQIKNRDNLVRTTRNLIYVEKKTLPMLLLNVAFLNLVTDQSDYDVRQASIELIAKTIECTNLKHSLNPRDFASITYTGSVNDIAYKLSDDIAVNNPGCVHLFIREFVKTMTYLNQNDFCVIPAFISPWMIRCGNEAIKNRSTLDAIAQIAAAIPSGDTMQFAEYFWSSITDESLFRTLLLKSTEFGNSSFISLFLPIACNSPQLSKMLANFVNEEQNTTSFPKASKILASMVISDTFDISAIPTVLHAIFISLFTDHPEEILPLFKTIYGKYVDNPDVITEELITPIQSKATQDYSEQTQRFAKIAGFINEIIEAIPQAREEFINLVIKDSRSQNTDILYAVFIFFSICSTKHNQTVEYSLFAQLHNKDIKSISYVSQAISALDLDANKACLVFCAGIYLLAYSQQMSVLDMIISSLKCIAKTKDINKLKLTDYAQAATINYIAQVLQIPLLDNPFYSLIAIAFSQNKHEHLINELNKLGVKHDLIDAFLLKEGSIKQLKGSKHLQEISLMIISKFEENPTDLDVVHRLNELVDMYPKYFVGNTAEKILKVAAKSKLYDVLKLICSLAKHQKSQDQPKEICYFSDFLHAKMKAEVPAECISPMLDGLFGKMF